MGTDCQLPETTYGSILTCSARTLQVWIKRSRHMDSFLRNLFSIDLPALFFNTRFRSFAKSHNLLREKHADLQDCPTFCQAGKNLEFDRAILVTEQPGVLWAELKLSSWGIIWFHNTDRRRTSKKNRSIDHESCNLAPTACNSHWLSKQY